MRLWPHLKHHVVPTRENAYRPHLLARGWMTFFLAAVLATEGFLVASLVARQSSSSFLAAVVQSEVIAYTNDERAQNHDGALAESAQLDAAAQAKANDMAAKGYFSHTGPDGKTPWQWVEESGYVYQYAGENLAVRFDDSQSVVDAWMASPTHRANIVKPQYTQIGVGVAQGMYKGAPATFVVQYFGTPLADAVPPPPVVAAPFDPAHSAGAPVPPAVAPPHAQVLGASVSVAQQLNSSIRQLPRLLNDAPRAAPWILGGIASLLILIVGLTFVMHLQVQPTDLLLPGVAVAAVALFLLAINGTVLSSGGQSAAVASAQSGALISDQAAWTGQ